MSRLIELSPDEIRFMQDSINCRFSNGDFVNHVVMNIANGLIDVGDIPLIRVANRNGTYYAFDNRRLYLYRVLLYRGLLSKVLVRLAPLSKFRPEKLTTRNNGKSIILRGDEALLHWRESSFYSDDDDGDDDDDYKESNNDIYYDDTEREDDESDDVYKYYDDDGYDDDNYHHDDDDNDYNDDDEYDNVVVLDDDGYDYDCYDDDYGYNYTGDSDNECRDYY